jgi:hypothetical protein
MEVELSRVVRSLASNSVRPGQIEYADGVSVPFSALSGDQAFRGQLSPRTHKPDRYVGGASLRISRLARLAFSLLAADGIQPTGEGS